VVSLRYALQTCRVGSEFHAVGHVSRPDLLDAVTAASKRDDEKQLSHLRASHDVLAGAEKMIVKHVADGLINLQIAHEFGVTEITVKDSPRQHDETRWGKIFA
jgi:FixJ family two-component response regulator